jgi:hypothetical protein
LLATQQARHASGLNKMASAIGVRQGIAGFRDPHRRRAARSIGGWRFEGETAVEHWEMVSGQLWDAAFMVADPQFEGDARDFWVAK